MHTKERSADEVAYTLLIQAMADLEPRSGWTAADLPELADENVQLICRVRTTDVADALARDIGDIPELKGCGHNPAVILPALLEGACRRAIFHEVQEECVRREEFDAVEARAPDARRWATV
jgi:hypothetical protein